MKLGIAVALSHDPKLLILGGSDASSLSLPSAGWVLGGSIIISAIIFILSWQLSIRFYQKRDFLIPRV